MRRELIRTHRCASPSPVGAVRDNPRDALPPAAGARPVPVGAVREPPKTRPIDAPGLQMALTFTNHPANAIRPATTQAAC